MSTILFANNANSTLAGAITNTSVSLNVQAGAGALFPNPTSGQYFVCTLLDASTRTIREIIWVTARSGDVFTVVRAQEGTTAENWLAGDFISNQLTAGQMAAFPQSSGTIVDTSLIYYGVDTGVADSLVVTTSPTISSYVDGMVFEITPIATNLTSTPQINICSRGAKQFNNALAGYIVAGQKFFCSYDGTLGKMVLTTLPNTANTTMRGIARQATVTEGTNGVTTGSAPAFVTPEEVADYVAAHPPGTPGVPQVTIHTGGQSGTYTTPVGARWLYVEGIGGGASGQASSAGSGNAGGTTTFGTSFLTATGGGAPSSIISGSPGTATGGDVNGTGGWGQGGVEAAWLAYAGGGSGGALAGQPGPTNYVSGGGDGITGGTGCGGAGQCVSTTAGTGGGGGAGFFEKLVTSPASTYAYSVGQGGAAITNGSFHSGAGGDGMLRITAYF